MLQLWQQQSPHDDESRRTFNQQNTNLDEDEDIIADSTTLSMGSIGINRINVTA